jgi:hypothetical protein
VIQLHHRFQFCPLAIQLAERIHALGGFFGTQQLVDFEQALAQLSEFGADAGVHSAGVYSSALR